MENNQKKKQKLASTVSCNSVESFELNGQQLEKEQDQRQSSNVSQTSVVSL